MKLPTSFSVDLTGLKKYVKTGMSSTVKWINGLEEPTPFFIKAQSESDFIKYRNSRSELGNQFRQIRRQIKQSYQVNRILSPTLLREYLLAQQAEFAPEFVSIMYYDRSLKRLAQQFPFYASALEDVCNTYKEHLKSHPEKAVYYFYQDVINHIVLVAGNQIKIEKLLNALTYYLDLVPASLYQTILSQLNTLKNYPVIDNITGYSSTFIDNEVLQKIQDKINKAYEDFILEDKDLAEAQQNFFQQVKMFCSKGINFVLQNPVLGFTLITTGATAFWRNYSNTLGTNESSWLAHHHHPMWNFIEDWSVPVSFTAFNAYVLTRSQLTNHNIGSINLLVSSTALGSSFLGLSNLLPICAAQLSTEKSVITPYFLQTIGVTTQENGNSVTTAPDKSIAITGYTFNRPKADNMIMSKFTSTGIPDWSNALSTPNNYDVIGYSIAADQSGNFVAVGTITPNSGLILVKIASDGSVIWEYNYGMNFKNNYYNTLGQTIAVDADDNIIIGGTVEVGSGGYALPFLAKFTSNGVSSWAYSINIDGRIIEVFPPLISVDRNDNSYVVANTVGLINPLIYESFLAKFTTNGTVSWFNIIQSSMIVEINSLSLDINSNYILSGTATNSAALTNALIAKFNNNGVLSWAYTLGNGANPFTSLATAVNTNDNSIVLTGNIGNINGNSAYAKLLVAKITSNANVTWVKDISFSFDTHDTGNSITYDSDNDIILTGTSTVPKSTDYAFNVILAKLPSNGVLPDCSVLQDVASVNWQPMMLNVTFASNSSIILTSGQVSIGSFSIAYTPINATASLICAINSTSSSTGSSTTSSNTGSVSSANTIKVNESTNFIAGFLSIATFILSGSHVSFFARKSTSAQNKECDTKANEKLSSSRRYSFFMPAISSCDDKVEYSIAKNLRNG